MAIVDFFGSRKAIAVWLTAAILIYMTGIKRADAIAYFLYGYYPVIAPWVRKHGFLIRAAIKTALGIVTGSVFFFLSTTMLGGIKAYELGGLQIAGRNTYFFLCVLFIVLFFLVDIFIKSNFQPVTICHGFSTFLFKSLL